MKISIIGTGYVGLVTGATLSDLDNSVVCLDIIDEKIKMLNSGKSPIYEPGLEKLIKKGLTKKTLIGSTDVEKHISDFNNQISILSKENAIAGYGASGRANMFCNLTNLNSNIVRFIVDESPERCGRYIANTDIPIVDIETLENSNVNLIIIFAWNYSKMIIEKTQFRIIK